MQLLILGMFRQPAHHQKVQTPQPVAHTLWLSLPICCSKSDEAYKQVEEAQKRKEEEARKWMHYDHSAMTEDQRKVAE